jgi:hypothetical protein
MRSCFLALCFILVFTVSFVRADNSETLISDSLNSHDPIDSNALSGSGELPYGTPLGQFYGIHNFSNKGGSRTYDFLGWEYECVEYVNRYYYEIFDYPSWKGKGHAYQYFYNIPSNYNDITPHDNCSSSNRPATGDIMVWDKSTENQNHGHVAIVKDADDYSVEVIQQNVTQNLQDASYYLKMTYENGKYCVTSTLGPILGWLRTSREPNQVIIADDDKRCPGGVSYEQWGWAGTEPNTKIYKKSLGKGYYNGFHYASSLPKDNYDQSKYTQVAWWFFPGKAQNVKIDILSFIPKTTFNKSKQTTYYMCNFDTSYYNQYCTSTTVDQSATDDHWKSLFKDIELPSGWGVWVAAENITGETNKHIVFDAVKIVAHPW